ncbi:MAG: HipA domain-containing protein, partial [Actinomycetota bacterium]
MPRNEPLQVWLYDRHVATLTTKGRPGEVTCTYTAETLETWPANTPLLSCSLPVGGRPMPARPFFRGLLPEGANLQALAARAKLPTYDTFGMLARYGRDVAGALVIGTQPPGARDETVEPYDDETLEAEVSALPEQPLGVHDDSELSIAGLQGKLLLVALADGSWGRPIHGRPSTHILKVENLRFPGMAMMEVACLHLAREIGLTTIDAAAIVVGDTPCLVVSRFDRVVNPDGTVERRIHQEDMCQALGRDSEADRGGGKYERSGGPKLAEIAELLDRYSHDAVPELIKLVEMVTFNTVIGNADAHGKNVALLHDPDGTV